ncbi:MAG: NfeD family protein [Proteobacteria bacterium]|nr:NfeD family protein [Pseudomonadota bacterium]
MIWSATAAPWAWAVAAVVIAFLELPVPGSYLIWIACAAALTALAGFLVDLTLSAQLTVFVICNIGTCAAGYFVYRHFDRRGRGDDTVNRRDLDLVGAPATVTEAFANGQGRVRLGDSIWLAECADDLAAGTAVVVSAVHGTTLVVAAKTRGV